MYTSNDIKILLGKRIKELRKKRGLTQEQLAENMDIDQRNLSKIECGNNFITSETLSKILFALDIDAKELFDFKHHKSDILLKKELIDAINKDKIDIKLLYQIYHAIST